MLIFKFKWGGGGGSGVHFFGHSLFSYEPLESLFIEGLALLSVRVFEELEKKKNVSEKFWSKLNLTRLFLRFLSKKA